MTKEHHKEVVRDIIVGCNALLFLSKIVREASLEIGTAGGKNNLVAVDRLAFYH